MKIAVTREVCWVRPSGADYVGDERQEIQVVDSLISFVSVRLTPIHPSPESDDVTYSSVLFVRLKEEAVPFSYTLTIPQVEALKTIITPDLPFPVTIFENLHPGKRVDTPFRMPHSVSIAVLQEAVELPGSNKRLVKLDPVSHQPIVHQNVTLYKGLVGHTVVYLEDGGTADKWIKVVTPLTTRFFLAKSDVAYRMQSTLQSLGAVKSSVVDLTHEEHLSFQSPKPSGRPGTPFDPKGLFVE